MNLTPSMSIKDEFAASYQKNGFVLFNDLIKPEQAISIRTEFLEITADLSKRYKIQHTSDDPVRRAYEVFAEGGIFRRHIYGYFQQLRSITCLVGSDGFTQVFKKMGLRFPVLRNQALRIDFPDEPQFLQGIHQDVRGMRSSNCLNFWICLQDVDEHKGTFVRMAGKSYGRSCGSKTFQFRRLPDLHRRRGLTLSERLSSHNAGTRSDVSPLSLSWVTSDSGEDSAIDCDTTL